METQTSYPQRVPRQRWEPPNDTVAGEIDAVVALYEQQKAVMAEYKERLAALADPQGADVPISHLADRLKVERKTVYRHLGRTMQ